GHGVEEVEAGGVVADGGDKGQVRVQVFVQNRPVTQDLSNRGHGIVRWARSSADDLLALRRDEFPHRDFVVLGAPSKDFAVGTESDKESRSIDCFHRSTVFLGADGDRGSIVDNSDGMNLARWSSATNDLSRGNL